MSREHYINKKWSDYVEAWYLNRSSGSEKFCHPQEEAQELSNKLFEKVDSSKNLTPVANPSAFALNKSPQNQK